MLPDVGCRRVTFEDADADNRDMNIECRRITPDLIHSLSELHFQHTRGHFDPCGFRYGAHHSTSQFENSILESIEPHEGMMKT